MEYINLIHYLFTLKIFYTYQNLPVQFYHEAQFYSITITIYKEFITKILTQWRHSRFFFNRSESIQIIILNVYTNSFLHTVTDENSKCHSNSQQHSGFIAEIFLCADVMVWKKNWIHENVFFNKCRRNETVGKKWPERKIYKLKSGRRKFKLQQDTSFFFVSHISDLHFSIQIYLKEIKVLGWNKFYVAQKGQTEWKMLNNQNWKILQLFSFHCYANFFLEMTLLFL